MSPAPALDGATRGFVVPIGGAERKVRDGPILERFVRLCGERAARLVVIPTASELDETGERYRELFRDIGARDVEVLRIDERAGCDSDAHLTALDRADGLFMTGGNQLRLSTTIGGTRLAQSIRRRNAAGMHVAGTSAGAAFISEHMIAGGRTGATPRADMVQLAPGLGLSNRFIVDQHFRQRDRLGRLLTALAFNPFATGLGLDEDTAGFVGPDEVLTVVGSGGITVVDPSELSHSGMDSSHRRDPVSLIGIRLHILVDGGTYDFRTRTARAATPGENHP